MPEIIQCPQCQRQLRVPDDLAGRSVKCPTCGEMFTAAVLGEAPPPLESAAPSDATRPEPWAAAREPAYQSVDHDLHRFRNYAPHRGPVILVLGILSIVICGLGVILGPIAWILGNNDLAEIRAGRMDPSGDGLVQAGRICGIVGTCKDGLILGLYCCGFSAAIMGR